MITPLVDKITSNKVEKDECVMIEHDQLKKVLQKCIEKTESNQIDSMEQLIDILMKDLKILFSL